MWLFQCHTPHKNQTCILIPICTPSVMNTYSNEFPLTHWTNWSLMKIMPCRVKTDMELRMSPCEEELRIQHNATNSEGYKWQIHFIMSRGILKRSPLKLLIPSRGVCRACPLTKWLTLVKPSSGQVVIGWISLLVLIYLTHILTIAWVLMWNAAKTGTCPYWTKTHVN